MCGAEFPWSWFVLDVSYSLVLLGGATTLRARSSPPVTWAFFGLLAAVVGGFLLAATYSAQSAYGQAVAMAGTISHIAPCG